MQKFNNGIQFTDEYIRSCLRILANKRSITKFLKGDWDLPNLSLLEKYSKTKYYDKFIDYISKDITPSVLEEIYECCKVGMPIELVSMIDEDGIYVFSGTHIGLARDAYLKDYDYKTLLNPELTFSEANALYNEMGLNATKRLSGRLRRK